MKQRQGNPTRQDAVRQLLRRFRRCLGSRARQSGGGRFGLKPEDFKIPRWGRCRTQKIGTRYVLIGLRTLVNPTDPKDLEAVLHLNRWIPWRVCLRFKCSSTLPCKLVLLVARPARKNPDANQRLELMVFGEGKNYDYADIGFGSIT